MTGTPSQGVLNFTRCPKEICLLCFLGVSCVRDKTTSRWSPTISAVAALSQYLAFDMFVGRECEVGVSDILQVLGQLAHLTYSAEPLQLYLPKFINTHRHKKQIAETALLTKAAPDSLGLPSTKVFISDVCHLEVCKVLIS